MKLQTGFITLLMLAKISNGLTAETNAPAGSWLGSEACFYRLEDNGSWQADRLGPLTNFDGWADLPRIRESLDWLRSIYRGSDCSSASVTFLSQGRTNGMIRIEMANRTPGEVATLLLLITNATAGYISTAAANTPPSSAPKFDVRAYLVEGNTVLPPEDFGMLSNYTGTVDFARIREGLGKLQLHYRELGFATIGVTLPQQKITNGVIRVKIVEGRLAKIRVEGNHFYSSNNVLAALPSLDTNILLNTKWFQPELDRANANADRQIYPVINPGLEPGTSDLTLQVKDRLPLHGHIEINNKSSPNTPELRLDTALQYNNLWQLNHQVGFDYNFSPQSMKTEDEMPRFYNQPMVASYSGYYRVPLGYGHGLREDYDQLPVNFGYNEITHRFDLPPATGRPELIVYASGSVSDTAPLYSPLKVIVHTNLLDIDSQSAQHDLTYNENLGTKLTLPAREFLGVLSSFTLGFDFKSYSSQTFSTNLTYVTIWRTNDVGERVVWTNLSLALPNNSSVDLNYTPLSFGWSATRPDPWGITSFNFNDSVFLADLASARTNFQIAAGSSQAGGNYTTLNAGLVRQQKLFADWSLLLRANGQWASEPLINNEQFALGGTAGVRGYQEGEVYGDDGWRVMCDLNAPPLPVGSFPDSHGGNGTPAYLRCSGFMDYGEAYVIDRPAPADVTYREWGTGLGFYLTAGEHFDARLTVAWALHDTPATRAGEARAYFSVGLQF